MSYRRLNTLRFFHLLLGLAWIAQFNSPAQTTSNVTVRVMAANLTSGSLQSYEGPGMRIFQGLHPDIVAIQEFQYAGSTASNDLRTLVSTAFGTNFNFYCEPNTGIPNGVVSRYPILDAGSWDDGDAGITDRGFAWAQIDLPGSNDLYVVSVHLKASSGADNVNRRAAQAAELKTRITNAWAAGAWIIVAGDMNLYSESEGAITTLRTFLSDSPVPADQNGDTDTNSGRDERYDRVLPSFSLTNALISVVMPSRTYTNGLVFDSRVYTSLADVSPVQLGDSGAANMQHMGVVKDFKITFTVTNGSIAPVITNPPQSLTVTQNNNATFSVLAGGTAPLGYQWRFATTNIAGATTSSYTRNSAQTNHAGDYTVVITNSVGSITSSIAKLTVLVPPTVAASPSNLVVTQNQNAIFTASAGGTPTLGYQWRFNSTNIAGATASTYTRVNAQNTDAGNYLVVVTNAAGAATSSIVTLTVLVPPTIGTPPQSQAANQGDAATFVVTANGSLPLSYQWRFGPTDLVGATSSSFTRSNVQPAHTGDYSVWITNAAGSVTSAPATLSLQIPRPSLTIPLPGLLTWQGLSNLSYTVQGSTNLHLPAWENLGAASSISNKIWFAFPPTNEPAQWFRVVYP